MTTRLQREHLIPVEEVDARIDDDFVARIWHEAYPKQPLPDDLPSHVRSCARAYLGFASIPSRGELGLGLRQLHDRLTPAIKAHDGERAAEAFEQTPGGVLAELQRHFPGIPSADDLRRPDRGIECAKDLLGCCVSGADIVPGRRRPGGRQSPPGLRILPRYRQRRGYPPQEAEMMLVRSLGEYFYNRKGKFPGLASHGGRFAPKAGHFAHLVTAILDRCGVNVNAVKLLRRCLREIPKPDTLSPRKGPVGNLA